MIRMAAKLLQRAGRRLEAFAENGGVTVLERDGDWVLCRARGFSWRLDPRQYVDAEIVRYGIYERDSTLWLPKLVKPGMVVADVGANFGYYALQLSRLVGSEGRVHAFEPSVRFRERLQRHLAENGCDNVTVSDVALSDEAGEQELFVRGSTASFQRVDSAESESVLRTTLDRYVDEAGVSRLDFVKVDIDGHEPRFLAGAVRTLRRFQPVVLMEFSHLHLLLAGSGVEDLARTMAELGYTLCPDRTGKPFADRVEFLTEAMNCSHSVNILCHPASKVLPE